VAGKSRDVQGTTTHPPLAIDRTQATHRGPPSSMGPVQRTRVQLTLLALFLAVPSVTAHSHAVLEGVPADADIAATPMMGWPMMESQSPIVWGG
jgi:hypothetical protein